MGGAQASILPGHGLSLSSNFEFEFKWNRRSIQLSALEREEMTWGDAELVGPFSGERRGSREREKKDEEKEIERIDDDLIR